VGRSTYRNDVVPIEQPSTLVRSARYSPQQPMSGRHLTFRGLPFGRFWKLADPALSIIAYIARPWDEAKQASGTTLIFFGAAATQIVLSSLWQLDRFGFAKFTNKVGEFASEAFDKSLGESLTTTLIAATLVSLLHFDDW
jgi:hypothetical protein